MSKVTTAIEVGVWDEKSWGEFNGIGSGSDVATNGSDFTGA